MGIGAAEEAFRRLTKGIISVPRAPKIPKAEPVSKDKPDVKDVEMKDESNTKSTSKNSAFQLDRQMTKIRKEHGIKSTGYDIPHPITEFDQLNTQYSVDTKLISNLREQKYEAPTPVQMQCWPLMLRQRDVLVAAPTGSGKTAAFVIPVLHCLKRPRALGFRAVIVSHTKELTEQIYRESKVLAEGTGLKIHMIDKGKKVEQMFGPKTAQKFDILITTPNRLVHIIQNKNKILNLDNVEWLVVDECDKLFQDGKGGFRDQLSVIYQACSGPHIHRAFLSATHSPDLLTWCREALPRLATVAVGQRNTASVDVAQELVCCGDEEMGKMYALREIFRQGYEPPCLIFVQTKERCRQLFRELVRDGVYVDAIHADRTAKQREQTVEAFREKKIFVLICTELMSRGIDFKGVNLVINYDMPPTMVSYVHRVGRTGRAGRPGRAVTFWTVKDHCMLGLVARNIKSTGGEVKEWMTQVRNTKRDYLKTFQNKGCVSNEAKLGRIEHLAQTVKQQRAKVKELEAAGKKTSEEGRVARTTLNRSVRELKEIKSGDKRSARVMQGRMDKFREKSKARRRKGKAGKEGEE